MADDLAAQDKADPQPWPMTRYPLLFAPLTVNRTVLANRVVDTAMVTRLCGEDGFVNQAVLDRHTRFAQGEAGLIVVEATAVGGAKSGPLLRLFDDAFIPGHRDLVGRVHATGPSKIAVQIIHFLKIARSGWRQTVDMLSEYGMSSIVRDYAEAAARASEAGYDAVELHMAHAYTLSSFLSARNRRRDRSGGRSLESRLRLPWEVLARVRERVGADLAVGVRFDAEKCIQGGYGLGDARQMALRFAQLGADYVSLSAGGKFEEAVRKDGLPLYPYTGYSGDRAMPPAAYQDGANVYLVEAIKACLNVHGYNTSVVATGNIATPARAEAILLDGRADLVGFARALLADPDWPKKARLGRADRIVRCIYGNICKNRDENFQQVRCGSLWPPGRLHAPEMPDDTLPPAWPGAGALLTARLSANGQLRLTRNLAVDSQGVYSYEVFRAVNGGPLMHLTSSLTAKHVDESALAGNRYLYPVRVYDFVGNRSPDSNAAEAGVSPGFMMPAGRSLALDGNVEAMERRAP